MLVEIRFAVFASEGNSLDHFKRSRRDKQEAKDAQLISRR